MSRYSLLDIPDWVNWVFTDQDGDIFGCDNKPCNGDGFNGNPANDKWYYIGNFKLDDWQDSLENIRENDEVNK